MFLFLSFTIIFNSKRACLWRWNKNVSETGLWCPLCVGVFTHTLSFSLWELYSVVTSLLTTPELLDGGWRLFFFLKSGITVIRKGFQLHLDTLTVFDSSDTKHFDFTPSFKLTIEHWLKNKQWSLTFKSCVSVRQWKTVSSGKGLWGRNQGAGKGKIRKRADVKITATIWKIKLKHKIMCWTKYFSETNKHCNEQHSI